MACMPGDIHAHALEDQHVGDMANIRESYSEVSKASMHANMHVKASAACTRKLMRGVDERMLRLLSSVSAALPSHSPVALLTVLSPNQEPRHAIIPSSKVSTN